MQKDNRQLSFSTIAIAKRKIKRDFFSQIDQLPDWIAVDTEIKKHYAKETSVAGRPSYPGLLLFKMSLLQTWYGLSDYEVEDRINDSLSFMQFVGLTLEDEVPDNSVLSRFRTTLTQKNAYEPLMELINGQLETKGIVLKKGAIVDASITDSPRKPRGKKRRNMSRSPPTGKSPQLNPLPLSRQQRQIRQIPLPHHCRSSLCLQKRYKAM